MGPVGGVGVGGPDFNNNNFGNGDMLNKNAFNHIVDPPNIANTIPH